jgi:hypothetical protein
MHIPRCKSGRNCFSRLHWRAISDVKNVVLRPKSTRISKDNQITSLSYGGPTRARLSLPAPGEERSDEADFGWSGLLGSNYGARLDRT